MCICKDSCRCKAGGKSCNCDCKPGKVCNACGEHKNHNHKNDHDNNNEHARNQRK